MIFFFFQWLTSVNFPFVQRILKKTIRFHNLFHHLHNHFHFHNYFHNHFHFHNQFHNHFHNQHLSGSPQSFDVQNHQSYTGHQRSRWTWKNCNVVQIQHFCCQMIELGLEKNVIPFSFTFSLFTTISLSLSIVSIKHGIFSFFFFQSFFYFSASTMHYRISNKN